MVLWPWSVVTMPPYFFFFPSLFCSQDVLIATGNTIQLWDLRQSKRVLGPASSDA